MGMTSFETGLRSFHRGALFVAGSTILASCMCFGSNASSSSSGGCSSIDLTPRCDAGAPVSHGQLTGGSFLFSCIVSCDPGYYDCDGRTDDGCESTVQCASPFDKDSGKIDGATASTTVDLDDAPRGLAVCGGVAYVLDGNVVKSFAPGDLGETSLAFLLTPPAGGLACAAEGGVVFVETGGDAVAPTLVHVGPDAASAFGEVTNPGSGVLADDGGVFWPEKDDGGAHLVRWADDASTSLGVVDDLVTDKPFARGGGETFVLRNGAVVALGDAAVPLWDGGSFTALAAGDDLVAAGPTDAGAFVVGFGDGGVAFDTATAHALRVLRRVGQETFVGFDDAVGRLSSNGALVMYAIDQKHVVDVAVDATWVYWVTLGDVSELPKLHRAKR